MMTSPDVPTQLYRHYDANGSLLYVGISLSTVHRLGQHAYHSDWFKTISRVSIETFPTREAALLAERKAITEEGPLHNKHHTRPQELPELGRPSEDSEGGLIRRLVTFRALYSPQQAAEELGVRVSFIQAAIDQDKIGYIILSEKMRNTNVGPRLIRKIAISGWQLIEFIESLEETSKTKKDA